MAIHNSEIAGLFERLADLLEIEGANPFRVRAYRNAARIVGGNSRSMADMLAQGEDLSQLPEIGKDLAKKIATIVQTGKLPLLEEVQARTPAALSELMKIEGVGPKRVKTLFRGLDIRSLDDLRRAARSGKIRALPGFGEKTERAISERLERFGGAQSRTPLAVAEDLAAPLVAYLKAVEGVLEVTVAGSLRRRKETVGDVDIVVTARRGSDVMERFVRYDEVDGVISRGETRSTVRLHSGLQVDLRLVPQVSYGAALHYFTGSKAHNIAVRRIGVSKGYKINEYGVFRGGKRVAGQTEEQLYRKVGLRYIEPELREDRGEIEAARENRLPRLIRVDDIRGDLHCHTRESDGHHSLQQMAEAAAARGYEYLAITEHSQHVTVAHGLDKHRLLDQIRAIDRLNDRSTGMVVLKAIELDILEDGSLDLPDSVIRQLDLTVCSVHFKFNLPRKKQTDRILRAMDNPYFNILAHPSGRLINQREPYDFDLERIMRAAAERNCFLEVNSQPDRLDLTDDACKLARDMGVRLSISTDAHSINDLGFMRFGVGQARRGWIEPDAVINTRPLDELRTLLQRH